MALGECARCRTPFRFGSATCSQCGLKKPRLKYLLAGVVVVQAVTIAAYMHFRTDGVIHIASSAVATVLPGAELRSPAGWLYYQTHDELMGDTTRHARVISRGVAGVADQRNHGTTGVLELRASPAYGSSVLITLRRDNFDLVDARCPLHVQIDDGEMRVVQASASVEGDSASLIVDDPKAFAASLLGAHTLSVDAQLSEKTRRVAVFDIGGLRWN